MTGGIKSSEENRAQDAACSWKTGEYLDAYGKPTGERFITTERISARFDSNYVNDADGSACVRYIVCSDHQYLTSIQFVISGKDDNGHELEFSCTVPFIQE